MQQLTEFDGKQLKYTTKDGLGTEDGDMKRKREHFTLQVLKGGFRHQAGQDRESHVGQSDIKGIAGAGTNAVWDVRIFMSSRAGESACFSEPRCIVGALRCYTRLPQCIAIAHPNATEQCRGALPQ